MKQNRIRAVLIIIIVLIFLGGIVEMSILGNNHKPLHQQIADMMQHSFADPRLEHCVTRYGDEFTISDTGDVLSTRFNNMQVYLQWNEEESTYQDYYIVYLRQEELEDILNPLVEGIYGNCRAFVTAYRVCPSSFNKETSADQLLQISNLVDYPVVQLWIFTSQNIINRDTKLEMFKNMVQTEGYSLCANIVYTSEENLAILNSGNFVNHATSSSFYRCRCQVKISPNDFCWVIGNGWREGQG